MVKCMRQKKIMDTIRSRITVFGFTAVPSLGKSDNKDVSFSLNRLNAWLGIFTMRLLLCLVENKQTYTPQSH